MDEEVHQYRGSVATVAAETMAGRAEAVSVGEERVGSGCAAIPCNVGGHNESTWTRRLEEDLW